ncbi:MAG: SDR family NAD(P)-dependent oxidoreductase [Lachnospiraceae bacterium]|nr:SDR family NAD(P)-dependent oxidoreductase [Lachnospiraceae bacterium]
MYALVTGADHGVGLSLAAQLAQRGYYVTACRYDEKETAIDELAAAYPGQMQVITLDIGSDESVREMARKVLESTPCLDLLINDAGILGDMTKTVGDDLNYDEMLSVINVNALGTLRVTNALSEHVCRSTQKLIVNISSEAGSIQDCWREGWFGYCMSKAANNMQAAIVQNALRSRGVCVLQIHPGHVATYMRGHLDTTASITAEESAAGILRVALDLPHAPSQIPVFLDYEGKELNY